MLLFLTLLLFAVAMLRWMVPLLHRLFLSLCLILLGLRLTRLFLLGLLLVLGLLAAVAFLLFPSFGFVETCKVVLFRQIHHFLLFPFGQLSFAQ